MRTKLLVSLALLMVMLLSPLSSLLQAQTTNEDADIELLEPATDQTESAAPAPWPVCRNGHWIRSAPGYPPVCAVQHIDNLIGPLAPCSYIVIGGVRYHIVRVVKTSTGWIITVRRV